MFCRNTTKNYQSENLPDRGYIQSLGTNDTSNLSSASRFEKIRNVELIESAA